MYAFTSSCCSRNCSVIKISSSAFKICYVQSKYCNCDGLLFAMALHSSCSSSEVPWLTEIRDEAAPRCTVRYHKRCTEYAPVGLMQLCTVNIVYAYICMYSILNSRSIEEFGLSLLQDPGLFYGSKCKTNLVSIGTSIANSTDPTSPVTRATNS